MEDMIYIVGAGAVGKALAVSLKKEGKKVTILRGSIDNALLQTQRIRVNYKGEEVLEEDIEISTLNQYSSLEGVVVLTNKSYGNKELADKLRGKIQQSPLVILQNGLGVENPYLEQGFEEVFRCVLFMTSQNTREDEISYKPVAESPIGAVKSKRIDLNTLVSQLNSAYFQFKPAENIGQIVWEKAIINSVYNSVCPLLDVDNGIFNRDENVLEMARRIISECVDVAAESGIELDSHAIEERLLFISKMSDGQLISTLQDIMAGRRTEIDTLNLEIAKMAKESGKEQLATETKLLGELTKLKSLLHLKSH